MRADASISVPFACEAGTSKRYCLHSKLSLMDTRSSMLFNLSVDGRIMVQAQVTIRHLPCTGVLQMSHGAAMNLPAGAKAALW